MLICVAQDNIIKALKEHNKLNDFQLEEVCGGDTKLYIRAIVKLLANNTIAEAFRPVEGTSYVMSYVLLEDRTLD